MSDAAPADGRSGRRGGAAGATAPLARADSVTTTAATAGGRSAGAMIRQARLAQGLHIAALAAAIKVSQHKLELLEADRVDQLPDATFARALAQTVCRFLKIDPQPVLAQLPQLGGYRLEQLSDGINAPFRDRAGQREHGDWSALASPAAWGPALLVLAAFALYVAPAGWLGPWPGWASRWAGRGTATAPTADASTGVPAVPTAPTPPRADDLAGAVADAPPAAGALPDANRSSTERLPESAPAPQAAANTGAGAADPAGGGVPAAAATLQLRANAESWVEVVDARAQVLLSRMLRPGETVSLEGSMPLKLKVGNAAGTEAVFRGQSLNLAAMTRDNVARLELK